MAHAAPPPPGRQRRNAIIGAVVVVVGVVLAVVAIIGLNNPKGPNSADSSNPASSRSTSASPTTKSTRSSPSASTSSKSSPPPTTRSSPRSTPRTSASVASSLPLVILNNTGRDGLGALAQTRFQAKGWRVTSVQNYSNVDIISTCAYWDANVPGSEAAAQKLQQQFPNILRVKQRFDDLPSGPVVVVLNDDYS